MHLNKDMQLQQNIAAILKSMNQSYNLIFIENRFFSQKAKKNRGSVSHTRTCETGRGFSTVVICIR